ncbi:cation:dicarboxylate symporter family transporter [Paenibacillus taichungensis]
MATVFLAQAVGIELTLGQEITILLVLMLSSKGMAGVPGSAFLALSATAAALNAFPVAAVALLLGADRFMDTMRVFTNLMGNCVAAFVVAKWEGLLDQKRMWAVLSGEISAEELEREEQASLSSVKLNKMEQGNGIVSTDML